MPSEDTQFKPVHGMSGYDENGKKKRIYVIWLSMRQRVMYPKHKSFGNYGGRGIGICPEWDSFERFYQDMGDPPCGAQLGRIDNDSGYSPENCRWETPSQNSRNRSTTVYLEVFGETRPIADWCDIFAIRTDTCRFRLRSGWDALVALSAKTSIGRSTKRRSSKNEKEAA